MTASADYNNSSKEGVTLSPHNESIEALIQLLSTDKAHGLTSAQAQEKLAQHGPNKLREKAKKTSLQR